MLKFDVLVIGSGGSGMQAAVEAGKQGLNIALMSKVFPTRSATCCAQGGINAAIANADPTDTVEKHLFDTTKGSDYLGDQDAIEFFVSKLPECIKELDYLGVPYSRDEQGRLAQRPFGGASAVRTCFSADKTGQVILHTMYEQCLKHNVQVLSDWYLLELVVEDNAIAGVVAYNMKTGEILPILAKTVVLATGGSGRIYWSRTTNPFQSTGDGMAAALRAGVPLKDMELVQFHPTGLAGTGILMSEACRGEGGYLINNKGERFMANYAPDKMELATRDVVSQAIETEIQEGRGFGEGMTAHVKLDLRHLGKDKIMERLPQIRDLSIEFEGIDPIDAPIPIRPTCHYFMGGIDVVNHTNCATALTGLFAAGECSCVSIHGANRLGGNSLADVVVFGKYAGIGASNAAKQLSFSKGDKVVAKVAQWQEKFTKVAKKSTGRSVAEIRDDLAITMWNKVGVFRTEEQMQEALETINKLLAEYEKCSAGDDSTAYNQAFINYIELGSMLIIAKTVIIGAVSRKESRGSHKRLDYQKRDDEKFLCHSIITKKDDKLELTYRPVTITKFQPAERKY